MSQIGKLALNIKTYTDTFELSYYGCLPPATHNNVLTKADDPEVLPPNEDTKNRSGIEKMMRAIKYSAPQTYNDDYGLAKHMPKPTENYTKERM